MNTYNPLKSYPYSDNRLLIIDWASLAYHQMFSLYSTKRTSIITIDSVETEMTVWRNHMVSKMLKYIKLFNPKDIICALEGKNVWRFNTVKEYYEEYTDVYYDATSFFLRFDNFFFRVYKENDDYRIQKLDFVKDAAYMQNKSKKLKDMPERIKSLFWDLYLPNGTTPLLPKYKGTRSHDWKFLTPKSEWKELKEVFAKEVSALYRAKCVRVEGAEGDDVIYVATQYFKDKYDSIVVITRDSDFNQLLNQKNLVLYNHEKDELCECISPDEYLEMKILQGDDSDNINGIALPNKKNQLGKGTARTLLESTQDVYSKAKAEGWDNQYRRNQLLISMKYIPTHIQRTICETIDAETTTLCGSEELYKMGITDKLVDRAMQLKNLGFYSLLDSEYVNDNPDIFNPSNVMLDDEAEYKAAIKPKRTFDNLSNVFDDPLAITQPPLDTEDEVF